MADSSIYELTQKWCESQNRSIYSLYKNEDGLLKESTFESIKRGNNPEYETLKIIANELHVSLSDFFKGPGDVTVLTDKERIVVADFVNDLSDQILQILNDLQLDKNSFDAMGITYEEKAFYDILVKVRDDHGFPYAEDKCIHLAKEIKKLVDDKAQYADWSSREDIKSQLNMDLTVLLYKNGYPPEWDEEVFESIKKNDKE